MLQLQHLIQQCILELRHRSPEEIITIIQTCFFVRQVNHAESRLIGALIAVSRLEDE